MTRPDRLESVIEAQIRRAQERGEFDNLPGAGKPIPRTDSPDDDLWWVKDWVRREGLPAESLLPTSLRLARQVERLPDELDRLADEPAVRAAVTELNDEIAAWLRTPWGPPVALRPVEVEVAVSEWRARRTPPPPADPAGAADPGARTPRRRWNPFARRG
ncbi:DUF1992 domain-containing protein [Plantactinospora siamensis]|uniref:DUF1992 domain-containing protein n=1 Tax=Plantactinospora siamensis TaxID=555372 RepID=A0ABV6NYC2_9ACTN